MQNSLHDLKYTLPTCARFATVVWLFPITLRVLILGKVSERV
jgi:hypothetical protein